MSLPSIGARRGDETRSTYCPHCGKENLHPALVEWDCFYCSKRIFSPAPAGDPITRAKALYSLLKEQGFPEEYVSGVRWCIEEMSYFESRAREAEQRAQQMLEWLQETQKRLENLQREIAGRSSIQPTTDHQIRFYESKKLPPW